MTYIPKFPYNDDQIIITSKRVTLNSNKDSIFLFANESIGFSSNNGIHFNTNEIIMNSKKIQLGLGAREPLIKGTQLVNLFTKLFADLGFIGEQLLSAVDSNGNPIPTVQTAGNSLIKSSKRINSLVKNIVSKQNYTL